MTGQLVKRNFLIFIRDKGAVGFSLLSMGIVILLMAVFLGNINVEAVTALLKEYGEARDLAADERNAERLVRLWTIAGLLIVNSMMVTMTCIGSMVRDRETGRLPAFQVTPVKGIRIALGYIVSSALTGMIFCVLTLFITEGWILLDGGQIPGVMDHIRILGILLLTGCVFSFIMYLPAVFIGSGSAWSGFGTVAGTLVGFVGGIYLPMGDLPEKVGAVLKVLPVLPGASLLREIFTKEALKTAFAGLDPRVVEEYKEYMGITVKMGGETVSTQSRLLFLAGCGTIALTAAALALKHKKLSDR